MLSSVVKHAPSHPAALAKLFEHRFSVASEASPLVSLAMTLPAGSKFSVGEEDCGQMAAAYKHYILQGTREESRIALARKADLRPSPISSTLTHDLLTIRSNFHINYLPEMVATFKILFNSSNRPQMGKFDFDHYIKPAVLLDGQLAHEDSRVVLLEAARRAAYRTNNMYFPNPNELSNDFNCENLFKFHMQTFERSLKGQGYSFLLSVNDIKMIDQTQLNEVIQSNEIDIINTEQEKEEKKGIDNDTCDANIGFHKFREGESVKLNSTGSNTEFLIGFNVPFGGFNEKDYFLTFVLESILKRTFPNTMASVTSDTSLLHLHFKFDRNVPFSEIKGKLEEAVEKLRSIPEKLKDEDLIWAQSRAKLNQALAIESRDNRLLSFAHQFAFSGQLPRTNLTTVVDNIHLRNVIKKVFQGSKPVLVGRGNYKKMIDYNDLF